MKRAAIGIAVGGLLAPNVAGAGDEELLMPGLAFIVQEDSSGTWRTGLGLEVSYNLIRNDPPIFGAVAQLEFMANGEFRLMVGGQASVAAGVEAGLSVRFTDAGVIPGFQVAPFASALFAYGSFRTIFEPDNTLFGFVGGLKAPFVDKYDGWTFFPNQSFVTEGRPLRDVAGYAGRAGLVRGAPNGAVPSDPRIAEAWSCAAADEHAAFGAFIQLSVWLARLGAPETLVDRARDAARQELRHAESAFAIASRLTGASVAPMAGRRPVGATPSLARLAVINLLDGRINEGAAAFEAEMALAKATDPEIRAHLETLVVEERAHADLADDIEGWAREVGGASVAAALEGALAALEAPGMAPRDGEEMSDWGALGRLTHQESREAYARAVAGVRGAPA